MDPENVCLSGKTGSDRRTVKLTRLTHIGHQFSLQISGLVKLQSRCRRTQAMSTDGWNFSGDAVRVLQGGQQPSARGARKALSAEFNSKAQRRS
jgi:hypothetical protein